VQQQLIHHQACALNLKRESIMQEQEYDLETLALRAGRGDRQAGATLRRQLEPQLARIVRSTLRSGRDGNPLAKRVLAEARRVTHLPQRPGYDAPEHVVSYVVRRLCESVATALAPTVQPRRWTLDTVQGA
jgi:hypothetical protein